MTGGRCRGQRNGSRSRTQPRPGTGRRVLPGCRTGRRGLWPPAGRSFPQRAGGPSGQPVIPGRPAAAGQADSSTASTRPGRRRTAVPAEQGCRIGLGLEPGPVESRTRPPGARRPGHGQPFKRPAYPAYGPVHAGRRGFQAVFAVHSVNVMAASRVSHVCSDRLALSPCRLTGQTAETRRVTCTRHRSGPSCRYAKPYPPG